MAKTKEIRLGQGKKPTALPLAQLISPGLLAGGSEKERSSVMKMLAEAISRAGVPVFVADTTGTASSLAESGELTDILRRRLQKARLRDADFEPEAVPVHFFDLDGQKGLPLRVSITDFGPSLLAELLEATPAQQEALNVLFAAADQNGLEIIDFKDLLAVLAWAQENRTQISQRYGTLSAQSLSALERRLKELKEQGTASLFGEPELDIQDWLEKDKAGLGYVNILAAEKLVQHPALYASLMLWLLAELYENLPENSARTVRLVFFFPEAQLLFKKVSQAQIAIILKLVQGLENRGVGVFFLTASPAAIPAEVLALTRTRLLLALPADTAASRKELKACARLFPDVRQAEKILAELRPDTALAALSSVKDKEPLVDVVQLVPPQTGSRALSRQKMQERIKADPLYKKYAVAVDSRSAYEVLQEKGKKTSQTEKKKPAAPKQSSSASSKKAAAPKARPGTKSAPSEKREWNLEEAGRAAARTLGKEVGKSISRGLLGNRSARQEKNAGKLVSEVLNSFFRQEG